MQKPITAKRRDSIEINTGQNEDANNIAYKGLDVLRRSQTFWHRLASWGVELRGITPVALDERTDHRAINLFFLWFTISCNLLPYGISF